MSVVKQELPQHTVLQGMVGFNVVWEKGATFHKGTTNPIVIEKSASSSLSSSDEANAKVNELVRKIKEAGLEVATTTDIIATKWSKLLLNLNNAVQALSGVPLKQELKTRGYRFVFLTCFVFYWFFFSVTSFTTTKRKVFAACQREALQVLNAHHIKTVRIGLLVPSLLPTLLSLPDWLYNLIMPVRISSRAHGSAWEDLERKRTTEIDFLNGEIIRLAKLKGIATPVNERVVALIKEAERKAEGSPRIPPEKLYKLTTGKDLREEEQRQRLFFFVVLLFVAFFVVYKMFF
ncbi:2-dehydropantoate 2-reductase [Balamuthia mandrillaris]